MAELCQDVLQGLCLAVLAALGATSALAALFRAVRCAGRRLRALSLVAMSLVAERWAFQNLAILLPEVRTMS